MKMMMVNRQNNENTINKKKRKISTYITQPPNFPHPSINSPNTRLNPSRNHPDTPPPINMIMMRINIPMTTSISIKD